MLYHRDILKAAGAFVSKDKTRPAITGLRLKGGTVEATDGHALVRFGANGARADEFPQLPGVTAAPAELQAIVPMPAVKAACAATARRGSLPILEHVLLAVPDGADKVKLAATDLDTNYVGESRPSSDVFPATDKVFPSGEPVLRVGFDVSILARVFGALEKVARGTTALDTVTLEFHGPGKAMVFRFDTAHGAATGLVMPVLLTEDAEKVAAAAARRLSAK